MKISINKLGEYLNANPARRQQIIRDQKDPKPFVIQRYRSARKAIIEYFSSGTGDKEIIKDHIEELIKREYRSKFDEQDILLSIRALELFAASNVELDLSSHRVINSNSRESKINIEGLSISVHPDVIIHGTLRGEEFVGAIKLNISKSNVLDDNTGAYISTILHKYLQIRYPDKKVQLGFCVSYDVFTSKIYSAPKSFKLRRKQIAAACKEIKLIWPHV
ncbi:MAG: hypothetical protein RIC80_21120 [Cyclobacteriaceae bacterium]